MLQNKSLRLALRLATVFIALGIVAVAVLQLMRASPAMSHPVRVLAYSGFINSWGPGPDLARLFRESSGYNVEFQDAGDAGLILKKLALFPADLVLGFDQLSLPEAKKSRAWHEIPELKLPPSGIQFMENDVPAAFVPFDWSPLAFVDREKELPPPTSLDDLLDVRFKGSIALEDPRTTTPGLQFFLWVLDEKGVDEGFHYFEKLKPNLHAVFPSWSAAYGAFTKKQAAVVFSYLTSPIYHLMHDQDSSYRAEVFSTGQPPQVEYFAIPASSENIVGAEAFARFLLTMEAQKIIMQKNVMLPILTEATENTPFQKLLSVATPARRWKTLPELLQRRDELFERWRQLGL